MSQVVITALVEVTCGECHVLFGLEHSHHDKVKRTGDWFYCPNGHHIHYYESREKQLERQVAAEQQAAQRARQNAEWQQQMRFKTERQLYAQKGVTTKLKKRVANGVCPCCTRSFQNLSRHMATKHPEFPVASDA